MKTRLLMLVLGILCLATYCSASVFNIYDLTDTISVTVDGSPIANGGFDVAFPAGTQTFTGGSAYTKLTESDGTVSDIIVFTIGDFQPFYHVAFGSDPNLPVIPASALDLTTVEAQGLPANPYI